MSHRRREALTGIAFALPFLIGFAIFQLIPFLLSIRYTFTFGTGGGEFVGLDTYRSVFKSAAFRLAAKNTLRFIVLGAPVLMGFSLLLAVALQKKTAGFAFFRRSFLFPMVLPVAGTVMFFRLFFAGNGVLNGMLLRAGFPPAVWIESDRAFWIIVLLYVWKNGGYMIVLMLSGLAAIPPDFGEAAALEGATSPQRFWFVTLPLLAPTLFFTLVLSVVNAFKNFREAFLLAGANPDTSIYMLQHFMNNNFSHLNYQRLSVSAVLVFSVIFSLALCLYVSRTRVDTWQM